MQSLYKCKSLKKHSTYLDYMRVRKYDGNNNEILNVCSFLFLFFVLCKNYVI